MSSPEPGALLPAVRRALDRARRSGALVPVDTEPHPVPDGGIPFLVRLAPTLGGKTRDRRRQESTGHDPFLPWNEDLFVADLTPGHVCLLNRYSVLEPHLLVVTRGFEPQDRSLERRDFVALWRCLREIDGVGFYNSGPAAGASQPHFHLQLVGAPLGEGPRRAPLETVLRGRSGRGPERIAALPFVHALGSLDPKAVDDPETAGAGASELCQRLVAACSRGGTLGPYNLLCTREWMLLVPRRRGGWEGIEVNALGFAGSLLVRDREQLAAVERRRPLEVLRRVGWPSGPS